MNSDQQPSQRPSTQDPGGIIHDSSALTLRVPVSSSTDVSPNQQLSSSSSGRTRRRKQFVPNYRNFSLEDNPLSPRRFQSFSGKSGPKIIPNPGRTMSPDSMLTSTSSLTIDEGDVAASDSNPRHPPQLAEVASEALNDAVSTEIFTSMEARDSDQQVMSNFSQSGIVHLLPIDMSSPPTPHRMRSSSPLLRGDSGRDTTSTSPIPSMQGDLDGESSQILSGGQSSPHPLSSASRASDHSVSDNSTGSVTTSSGSDGPHITFRYQHIEDEHGHHLIVGREGTMTKCEDEVCVNASFGDVF